MATPFSYLQEQQDPSPTQRRLWALENIAAKKRHKLLERTRKKQELVRTRTSQVAKQLMTLKRIVLKVGFLAMIVYVFLFFIGWMWVPFLVDGLYSLALPLVILLAIGPMVFVLSQLSLFTGNVFNSSIEMVRYAKKGAIHLTLWSEVFFLELKSDVKSFSKKKSKSKKRSKRKKQVVKKEPVEVVSEPQQKLTYLK